MFSDLNYPDDAIALVEEASGNTCTYGQLRSRADAFSQRLPKLERRALGFIATKNDITTLVAYLGALRSHTPIALLDPAQNKLLTKKWIDTYKPDWLFLPSDMEVPEGFKALGDGLYVPEAPATHNIKIHDDIALLLSTSGSTGSSKMVRLSYNNLAANAESIAEYLGLEASDRAISSLPTYYCYGLSVIHSHLSVGARLLMTDATLMQKEFWEFFKTQGATFMAGVPYTYEMLKRLRFSSMDLPTLRIMTQAGGRLDPAMVEEFAKDARAKNRRFFVMYGQTEATARIAYMPPEKLLEKAGCIGVAIPKGTLSIDPANNELIYSGPNVMMGYAESHEDLTRGDDMKGVLRTGDLASCDSDGFFAITGRIKRFIKLFGQRLSLDEIERALRDEFGIPIACHGNDEKLHIATEHEDKVTDIKETVHRVYHLHGSSFKVTAVQELPRMNNGKLDYERLKESLT